jgi:hypothetical protein
MRDERVAIHRADLSQTCLWTASLPSCRPMGLIRSVVSLVFVGACLWFAFSVPLGSRTLAQHMDRIGQTEEARDLVDGTRGAVNPVLEEAKDRLLGEHVEAPTSVDEQDPAPLPPTGPAPKKGSVAAPGTMAASSPERLKLPGKR